jgi:hypothetical protein
MQASEWRPRPLVAALSRIHGILLNSGFAMASLPRHAKSSESLNGRVHSRRKHAGLPRSNRLGSADSGSHLGSGCGRGCGDSRRRVAPAVTLRGCFLAREPLDNGFNGNFGRQGGVFRLLTKPPGHGAHGRCADAAVARHQRREVREKFWRGDGGARALNAPSDTRKTRAEERRHRLPRRGQLWHESGLERRVVSGTRRRRAGGCRPHRKPPRRGAFQTLKGHNTHAAASSPRKPRVLEARTRNARCRSG